MCNTLLFSVSKAINTVAKVIPAARPIAPATVTATNQMKITLPVSQNLQFVSTPSQQSELLLHSWALGGKGGRPLSS